MSDVKRYTVTHAFFDPMHKRNEWAYVLASEHDAAISALASRLAEAERRVKELEGALVAAEDALARSYDVTEWPGEGSLQSRTLVIVRAALSPRHQSAEGAEGEGT